MDERFCFVVCNHSKFVVLAFVVWCDDDVAVVTRKKGSRY